MFRVLVTEKISQSALSHLEKSGYEVDVQLELDEAKLLDEIKDAHAIIIRSATKITKEVIAQGKELVVIGRAGIGLDNVDVAAATEQGIMVVNLSLIHI